MSTSHTTKKRLSQLTLTIGVAWIVVFLVAFFSEILPNNSPSANEQITRLDICEIIFIDFTTLLNPLDYSTHGTEQSGWHTLPQRARFSAVALILWLTAWIVGRAASSQLHDISSLRTSERLVIEFGTGLSLLTLWVLFCGVTGRLTPAFILLPIATALLLVIPRKSRHPLSSFNKTQDATDRSENKSDGRYLVLLALPFALHIVLGGFTPPFDFDVREYHMQGPKEWFQNGCISHLDHNVYTSFPFLSEMLSLAAMVLHDDWWSGAISGKLTLTAFQFLSTLSAYAIASRWFGRMPGIIAALAVISTPWTVRISIIAYAEGAASFYLIASVMTALLASAAQERKSQRSLWGLTGFMAGSAMAAKYPGVLSAVIPCGLLLLFFAWKETDNQAETRSKRLMHDATLFSFTVLIAVGPWLAKNYVNTGNPVYPLAYSVFGGDQWNPEMNAKWKRAHSAADHDVTLLPNHLWNLVARNDWQSGLLFALAIPSVVLLKRFQSLRWLWLHALWIVATWWFFTHRIDRFWVPIIPLIAVLAGASWRVSDTIAWQSVVRTAIFICCVYNFGFCRLPLIGFHAGLADIQTLRQQPIRNDIKLLNQTLPEDARVLMVGEAEVFDTEFSLVYNTVFDESIFEQWTSSTGQGTNKDGDDATISAESIRQTLNEHQITHIYVNWSEILRYRLTYGYTEYVVPIRFQQLQTAGLISKPTAMSSAEWMSLTEQQQAEILSWDGGSTLRNGTDYWNNIQLFKVTDTLSAKDFQ